MCGIAGLFGDARIGSDELHARAALMTSTLRHRGPDDDGVWVDAASLVALGHRRLSIVDLSAEGHQPMASVDGRYVITFNGEIYNHRSIRNDLERRGHRFRGHSDTEALLAAVTQWGFQGALRRANGMFALGMWDARDRVVHLARDRIGEKPLYYGRVGGAIAFASELKAIRVLPGFAGRIDRDALAAYFRFKYVPSPRSIYEGIRKLPPGSTVSIPVDRSDDPPAPLPFWDAREIVEGAIANPFDGSDAEAVEELDRLLREAVGLRMHADVPLGAFLSGGIDSSIVVALMQQLGGRPTRTFTIGSTDPRWDEARDARRIAAHLGTDHTELIVTSQDALGVVPNLPEMYDEPFADSSQIPTHLVSRLARSHVTVSLSGDGGDELFGGYNRHLWVQRIGGSIGWMPDRMRKMTAGALTSLPPSTWDRLFARWGRVLPMASSHRLIGDKVHRLASVLDARKPADMYLRLVSHWPDPGALVLGADEPRPLEDRLNGTRLMTPTDGLMFLDLVTYLPDDILAKVDRASMAVGLEARVPLLDHRIVEFAWRLPLGLKLRAGSSKWCLRQVLRRYVPPPLFERPKMGFGVPIHMWLRGPLRDWAEELFDGGRLASEGFLDAAMVRSKWQEHLTGRRNWQYLLWDVLMFEAWLRAGSAQPAESGAAHGVG